MKTIQEVIKKKNDELTPEQRQYIIDLGEKFRKEDEEMKNKQNTS